MTSRIDSLKKYNGNPINESERKDFELYYLKTAYRDYLIATGIQKVECVEDEAMAVYM